MADGQASPRAQSTVDELRTSIQGFEPQTAAESVLYAQMLTKIDDLYENREIRLLETQAAVPPFVWVVLLITGILMWPSPISSTESRPGCTCLGSRR